MKDKFKKFLAGMTMIPCAILAVACRDNPPPDEDPYDESVVTEAQYTELHPDLELFEDFYDFDEYGELKGRFGDIFYYEGGFAKYIVYSNGIAYDFGATESSDGTECIEWNIGKNLEIIDFKDDTLLVENSSSELIAYQNIEEEVDGVTTRKLYSRKLNCNLSNFRGIESGYNGSVGYYYVVGNSVKFHDVDMKDDELDALWDVYVNVKYRVSGDTEIVKVKDIYESCDNIYVLTENNLYCGTNPYGSSYDTENQILNLRCYDTDMQIYNVNKLFVAEYTDGALVSINGDDNNLYYYEHETYDTIYTDEETWYNEAAKVQLPTGYTVQNIKSFICEEPDLSPDILFEMTDGEYFVCEFSDLRYSEFGDTLQLTKIEGLKDVMSTNNVKRLYLDDGIMILMNDKNLYEYDFWY